jgi:two-component sensor histidine kinase/outer membrane protein assembly factor BamB
VRTLLAFLLVATCTRHGTAQATTAADERFIFSVRRYGTAEGLPQRKIEAIAQDPRGLIWLATPMGLVRYDGYTFANHTRADGMRMDPVKSVLCDGDGMLWVWHPDGAVDILDPRNGRFSTLKDHLGERSPARAEAPVLEIRASDTGILYYWQDGQLVRYQNAHDGPQRMAWSCTGTPVLFRVERNGDLWCACSQFMPQLGSRELQRLSFADVGKDGIVQPIVRIPDVYDVANTGHDRSEARPVAEQGMYLARSSGQTWASPQGALTDMDDIGDPAVPLANGNGIVRLPLSDDLWVVNATVRRMRAGDDPLKAPVLFDVTKVHPEARYIMNDALRDRAGNIWLAGEFGLFKITMRPDHFQRWLWDSTLVAGVGVNVRGMAVVDGRLHVSTQFTGYWTLDARSGAVLGADDTHGYGLEVIADGKGGTCRSDNRSVIHSGMDGREDRRYDIEQGEPGTWSILPLSNDRLLLGTSDGLLLADPSKGVARLAHADHPELDKAGIWQLQRDNEGRILCCTERGLFALNDEGMAEDYWSVAAAPVNGVSHQLPTDEIRYFLEDSAGVFWLATATQGLIRWHRTSGRAQPIGVREGLPATSIHGVYADGSGALWLPTDNGLVRYDPRSGLVRVFTTRDGITNDEFNRIANTQGPDGRLYFGGFNGITVVDPGALQASRSTTADLALTGAFQQTSDSAQLTDRTAAVLHGDPITLRPGDRFFTVDMALLTYDDPALIRYAWRIEGIDQEWNRQVEPHLRFTALPYGEHVLHITAMDADGRSSAHELTVPIIVLRPVYLRGWFIALCALCVAAIIYAVFRYRVRQLRQVIRVRDRIAMDLHDEVGSNLSGIVLFSSAVNKNANDLPEKAAGMLHRISDNSTRAMESMNDIVWSVNSQHDRLGDVLDRMRAYAQPLCEATGIDLTLDSAPGLSERKLGMEERKSLYLIFKEAVNNAIKHAQCSRITVELRPAGKRIELVVQDNGRGLSPTPGTDASLGGNGLGNMQRRATSVGGEFTVARRSEGGTEVRLRIPTGHG